MESRVALHRYSMFVACATFFLLFAGGLVTSTGSGLSVPDWPLSFGKLFPKMTGGVFFEHGHRLVAGTVVFLTLGLVVWILRKEDRPSVRWLGIFSIVAIFLQALLGGMTVLLKLPPAVSVAHAGLAQLFFCSVVAITLLTSATWMKGQRNIPDYGFPSISTLTLVTLILIYFQILLGAIMRHIGAGLAIPDFPLAFGQVFPPKATMTFPVVIHFAHRVGAVVVSIFVLWTQLRILRLTQRGEGVELRVGAWAALFLLFTQVLLGGTIIWTQKAVFPTTSHVIIGAALLATHLILFLLSKRFLKGVTSGFLANSLAT